MFQGPKQNWYWVFAIIVWGGGYGVSSRCEKRKNQAGGGKHQEKPLATIAGIGNLLRGGDMVATDIPERLKRFEIPGRVSVLEGNGEMPKIEVTTDWSTAEIYLQGAHVTDFKKKGEAPLLFTSQFSRFEESQPIRGGVPIIFPWFGAREGSPAHGFARLAQWELLEATTMPEGGVSLRFSLGDNTHGATSPPFAAYYAVTVTDKLRLELIIINTSADQVFSFENCLHTYLHVGDINSASVIGLKGASYLDKVDHFAQKTESSEVIKVASEVDRIYLDTTGAIEIHDPELRRKIRVEKNGSASTVVWNPWIAKAQQMPDFGNDEYKQMVCIECGNVARNKLNLPPARTSILGVTIESSPLGSTQA
jgi:D-hexose-6-phosphate mutarotase